MNDIRIATRSTFRLTAIAAGVGLLVGLPSASDAAADDARRVVAQGEVLSKIAAERCPSAASDCMWRYAELIYRANPQAFRGSPELLIVGSTLVLPPLPPTTSTEAGIAATARVRSVSNAAPAPTAPASLPRPDPTVAVAAAASTAVAAVAAVKPATAPAPAAAAQAEDADAPVAGRLQEPEADPAANLQTPLPVAKPADAVAAPVAAPIAAPVAARPPVADTTAAAATAPAATASAPAAAPAPAPAPAPAAAPGRVRVPYISELERKRIRDDLRDEILETARRENWAQPDAVPEWLKRFNLTADLLVRGEGQLYESGNNNQFFNFQAINGGPPINTTPPAAGQPLALPFLNTTEDRQLLRLRARIGARFTVTQDLSVNLRLASGNGVSPVSTNQTLGNDFNKLNILLDRAYLRYQPDPRLVVSLGRVPNPYAGALDLIWDRDLAFDGLSLSWSNRVGGNDFRVRGGGFSVENTDPNYPGNSINKVGSYDKWLAALQVEWSRTLNKDTSLHADSAVYEFVNIEGELSSPCFAPNVDVTCATDNSRPGFVQKGNTLFGVRDLRLINPGDPAFQYFGLASKFRVVSFGAGLDVRLAGPLHLAVDGEFARNAAFSRSRIVDRVPVNNYGPCAPGVGTCVQQVDIGRDAYQLQVRFGHPVLRRFGDWQGQVGYRYVESDAVPDTFTDSDFHLGGTNAKGYYVGGSFGFTDNATIGLRYLSATEISGPKLGIDVLQIDVSASFF
ncbi:MAG: putative porin [Gammaproteobacteria bacterium]|nr:putative porin [Gammaproteobacteria bacterium]